MVQLLIQQVHFILKLLKKALVTLSEGLKVRQVPIVRDGVIQRFEYVFELSWKTIKAAAEYGGVSTKSPREAIRYAYKMEWITPEKKWIAIMDARNLTSHTYDEATAHKVYVRAKMFPALVSELITALEKLLK